jgi:hypothetical protein
MIDIFKPKDVDELIRSVWSVKRRFFPVLLEETVKCDRSKKSS